LWLLILFVAPYVKSSPPAASGIACLQIFPAKGEIVFRHEAISNYMAAMTMPFRVKSAGPLAGLQDGDEISFKFHVTETESWVDQMVRNGTSAPSPAVPLVPAKMPATQSITISAR
jgi:hypothetical protein